MIWWIDRYVLIALGKGNQHISDPPANLTCPLVDLVSQTVEAEVAKDGKVVENKRVFEEGEVVEDVTHPVISASPRPVQIHLIIVIRPTQVKE